MVFFYSLNYLNKMINQNESISYSSFMVRLVSGSNVNNNRAYVDDNNKCMAAGKSIYFKLSL